MKHFYLETKENNCLTIWMFILCFLSPCKIFAYDIEVENSEGVKLCYNFINEKTELEVTYTSSYRSEVYSTYSGNVIIPESVVYEGKTYMVTAIGYSAFTECKGLMSVSIPNTITTIGNSAFYGCTGLTSIVLPNSINSCAGSYYGGSFIGCSNLNRVTLYCKNVGSWFSGLKNISEIIVGDEVEFISGEQFDNSVWYQNQPDGPIYLGKVLYKFKGNQASSNYRIKDGILSISDKACYGNTEVKSLFLPSSLKFIGSAAFQACSNLEDVSFPSSLETIKQHAFAGCKLSKVTIPENVKLVDWEAFSSPKEVIIESDIIVSSDKQGYGSSSGYTFGEIFGAVQKYIIGEGVTRIGGGTFADCSMQSIEISNSVTSIGSYAFKNCTGLSSIVIPKGIKTIGDRAFTGCTGLKKVITPDIAAWCNIQYSSYSGTGNQSTPLYYAKHLYSDENTEITELKIPEGVTSIGNIAFIDCDAITSVSFPSSLQTIGDMAFNDCKSLTTINIPNEVKSVGSNAFAGCTSLLKLTFPDGITSIGRNAFETAIKLYVNKPSITQLSMWQAGYKPYLIGTESLLEPPYLTTLATTQTTATFKIMNKYDEFKYLHGYNYYNREPLTSDEFTVAGLYPEVNSYYQVYLSLGDSEEIYCTLTSNYTTLPISPTVDIKATASSILATGTYIKGDAEVESQRLVLNPSWVGSSKIYGGEDVEGLTYCVTGLDPNTWNASFAYEIIIRNGNNTKSYRTEEIVSRTAALQLTTNQPKVVSAGNVIVTADSNLDDEETNVGFEWRRTDWTDDFSSNTGGAYLYEGTMEGYIRNLYTEKLWKYRPYYTSNSGKTYYGDWVGIDPTNTSYFEPTVHTYAKVEVGEDKATLNGYVMTGTDAIIEQGFEYWETQGSNANRRAPQDVQTIVANGQRMTATLTGLKAGTTYGFRAYVKTATNTTYGEERTFNTPAATGIHVVYKNADHVVSPQTFNVYTLSGGLVRQQTTSLEGLPRGIYIVNRKKVIVR